MDTQSQSSFAFLGDPSRPSLIALISLDGTPNWSELGVLGGQLPQLGSLSPIPPQWEWEPLLGNQLPRPTERLF